MGSHFGLKSKKEFSDEFDEVSVMKNEEKNTDVLRLYKNNESYELNKILKVAEVNDPFYDGPKVSPEKRLDLWLERELQEKTL